MRIPQKMKERWERHPQLIGMIAGFVAVPVFWWLQDYLLHLAFGFQTLLGLQHIYYLTAGAVPGAILGAGISKAMAALVKDKWNDAKRNLMTYGWSVFALIAPISLLSHGFFNSSEYFLAGRFPIG